MPTTSNRTFVRGAIPLLLATVLAAGLSRGEGESEAEKARLKKLDSGPKTVDVTKYPKEMQDNYALFKTKCVKCHNLARPINCNFVLPGEWDRYIKRMVFKPDSKMTEENGKQIYQFLVYDSSVRKADSLRVHLAALAPEDRDVAIGKIKALNPAFEPAH